MFSRLVERIDAIESSCLRILVFVLIVFIPIGLFFGLLESEFRYWEWLLIWPGIFTIVGAGVALVLCVFLKLMLLFSGDDFEEEPKPNKLDNSALNLPTELRRCRKCGCEKMSVIERDESLFDAYDFKCPECGHHANINESGTIGVFTGGSLILFAIWFFIFSDDTLDTAHDYFTYISTLIIIWYLPVSMTVKRWRHPITVAGKLNADLANVQADESSDPVYRATRIGNIWLSTVGFLSSLLAFIVFIAIFLGGAVVLGIINDEGIESLWNGRFWAIIWEGIQLLIN